jgi:hypothetical protein
MTPEHKRLADRILKLLALASSTTFTAEAQTARAMADKLMAEHNVKIDGKPDQSNIERRDYTPFAKGMRWEGIIAGALADVCSSNIYFDSKVLDHYCLVGTVFNLDCLQYMLAEVNRQRIHAWLAYKGRAGSDSFNKFCYAFAIALERKCKALTPHDASQNHDRLRLWYETNILHRKVNSFDLAMGDPTSQAGAHAGANASLHRGALGEPQRRLK